MDYEERYRMQLRMNEGLKEKVAKLEKENEELRKEAEWNKSAGNDKEKLQKAIEELEASRQKFQDGLRDIKEKRKQLDNELRESRKSRDRFETEVNKLIDNIRAK